MWKIAALFGLIANPVWAANYLCQEWSNFVGNEAGTATLTVTEDQLIWSNGQTALVAENIANDRSAYVYQDVAQVFLAPHLKAQSGPFQNITLRRVKFLGEPEWSTAECVLTDQ